MEQIRIDSVETVGGDPSNGSLRAQVGDGFHSYEVNGDDHIHMHSYCKTSGGTML